MTAHARTPRPARQRPTRPFESLEVGQRASVMRTVMGSDLAGFAEAAGDTGGGTAEAAFGQRVAQGMFTANLVAAAVGTRLIGPDAVYLSQTLQFLAPIRVGDVVTASVEVVELVASRRRARLFCECLADGRPVLEGEAWIALPTAEA